ASAGRTLVAGLPGNPQSAIVALVSLVAPALAGLAGRTLPELGRIRLGAPIPGRGGYTHLGLVDRAGRPVPHVGSAMLRGVAVSHRLGRLNIGDVALVAAVSTAHRAAAFAACARLVDQVKARLPVWKRQVFADGTEEWVNSP